MLRSELILDFLYGDMFLENVRKLVKAEAHEEDWKYHIVPVVHYAKLLAEKLGADIEVAELAALLHDMGRLRHGGKDHEITGVPIAEEILRWENYSDEIISEVKHCVATHRWSKDIKPETLVAKIIANADAMAHFDVVPVFFYRRAEKYSFEEAFEWIDLKIKRDWEKKITLPEAKILMQEKYDAIQLLLNVNREYL